MNYTLHQLHIYLKVVRNRSITGAAEELNLTQPAVSIQLKNFQKQFDQPLTEVINRRLHITEFGRQVSVMAEKILVEAAVLQQHHKMMRDQLKGRLRISVVSTGKYVMPYFLSGFMAKHQGVELSMDVTNKTKVTSHLQLNETDLALISVIPAHLKLKKISLMDNKLYLICKPGMEKKILKKKTDPITWIYREQGSATRYAMEHFISKSGMATNRLIELSTNEAVKQAVMAGLGYAIMSATAIKNEIALNQICIIPIKGLPIIQEWKLIWLAEKKLSPVTEAFIRYIQEHKKDIIEKDFAWLQSIV
jgi:DNA-binding transcriptional LysR family regulator